jgi:hypothetical protein
MKILQKTISIAVLSALFVTFFQGKLLAQRTVHWQVNPQGFPDNVSIFADVEEGGAYIRNLPPSSFSISIDEFAEKQGGIILNAALKGNKSTGAGWSGAQVLILIDKSQSYSKQFKTAKAMAKKIIESMDPSRDTIAIAGFPTEGGYSESRLIKSFSNDRTEITAAVDDISFISDKKTGGRICPALSESLNFFPVKQSDKYRVIVLLTGGADKGEGKGNCIQDSYAKGLVPFWTMGFKLDRKYDNPRNAHKIENGLHDLAAKTGGLSMFRKSVSEFESFAGTALWNRIRSQYRFDTKFMCYKPAPQIEHISVLKVDGQPYSPIKFKAPSAPAPVPVITALYPSKAPRNMIDDGKVTLTIDGSGFCGVPGQIRIFVDGRQVETKSAAPYRVTAMLNAAVSTGVVKVLNKWTQSGVSATRFVVVKPPKGAQASGTIVILVIVLVGLVALALVLIALKSRKATVPAGAPPVAARSSSVSDAAGAKTAVLEQTKLSGARIIIEGGEQKQLMAGDNIIGREPHCHVVLPVEGVSREHAKLTVNESGNVVTVQDLGSTNGTLWGAKGTEQKDAVAIKAPKSLASGDCIWIGNKKITVILKEG